MSAVASLLSTTGIDAAEPTARIKAIAFDGLVIFDLRSITALAEECFPGRGTEFSATWRTQQFAYTWLRTMTGNYADFWQVTDDALTFTSKSLGLDIPADKRERLMGAYLRLKAWPDVLPTLTAFKDAGIRMALLTDFSVGMIDANIQSAGLDGFFKEHLSTDRVRAFKPDPRAYRMGTDVFKLKREEIAFVAFGGWDAIGAKSFGYPTFWCNRLNRPIEELGVVPDRLGSDMADLATFVRSL